jgi:hypothetical protein
MRCWRRIPHVTEWYLDAVVFPATMEHQNLQLSASGHDLGGDVLFARRLGFSWHALGLAAPGAGPLRL